MTYDLVVIGAGWAGFNAALTAKKLGGRVCLIEEDQLGGTCLNRGCIPTKTILQSSKVFELSKKAKNFAVDFQNPAYSFAQIHERKEKIVSSLRSGMQSQLSGLDLLSGKAQFVNENRVSCCGKEIESKAFVLATGSSPMPLAALAFDPAKVISSDQLLSRKGVPASLCIVGGGVIGCEFAGIFSALGTAVTVIELMPQLLPGEDPAVARKLEISFKKKGIKVMTSTDASKVDLSPFETVLVSIGRSPNTQGLGGVGFKTDRKGFVVDDNLKTSCANVWAAGDCTGKLMLAHYAAYQGRIAAHNALRPDQQLPANNAVVPSCIFTSPEIASVGISEQTARARSIPVKVYSRDFLACGMARILDETEGFIKIVSEEPTGKILGAAIIGPRATELIAVFCVAVTNGLTVDSLRSTILAHPSVAEIIHDCLE